VNQSFLRLMKSYDERDYIGKNPGDFITSGKIIQELRDAVVQKGNWQGELAVNRTDMTPIFISLWANIVRDDKKRPVCTMVSFIDITERKQMELAKRRALEQIEKNIEQFAVLGDHIRNPLAVIVGLASLAAEDIAHKILAQTREIDRIITQLDMGWIESEKVRDFIRKYYQVSAKEIKEDEVVAATGDGSGKK
jgi:signal transduction histidine kinase